MFSGSFKGIVVVNSNSTRTQRKITNKSRQTSVHQQHHLAADRPENILRGGVSEKRLGMSMEKSGENITLLQRYKKTCFFLTGVKRSDCSSTLIPPITILHLSEESDLRLVSL